MDLSYGAEYDDFREQVRTFLSKHGKDAPPNSAMRQRPSDQEKAWQKLLIENGYTGRTVPKQYGGFGAEPDLLKAIIIDEEFDAAGVNKGLSGQGISMLIPTLLEVGSEEQREQWIRPTLHGDVWWCQGYSEPGAGSDLASLRTRAHVEDGHFVINGQKIWTSGAHLADMCFILVRTEPDAPKHKGISYLLLPMDSPGIELRPLYTMTGEPMFNEFFLTDVKLPVDQIVGERGMGWLVANATLKHERGMLGDPSLTENYLTRCTELMKTETVDGVCAMDSPIFRDRLVALQARAKAMRYHSLRLTSMTLKGEDPGVARLVVKLNGTVLNHDICSLAVDVMGELGTLFENSKYLRAQGFWQSQFMFSLGLIIGGGTAQIQKNIIAERGLAMPREPKPAQQ